MIGIIGAMQEEIDLLYGQMKDRVEMNRSGIVFFSGSLNNKPVVLCKSGVGKVNAAVYTQVLIDRFSVKSVIFTGVAGAVDPELNIGDIVISTSCLQHDVDVTALGYPRGVIPYQETSEWKSDEKLSEIAEQAGETVLPGRVKLGKVLSGDQFIADREKVKELYETFGGACTEMEGAAVAQVCAMNGVGFVIIRSMSDKADGSASVNFAEFTVAASNNSYKIVNEMLKRI
ncbi:5'-methylthioadenosine/adenosylhomocysteine nucleosidase [Cohnella sp. AR92]|uniref:5'-methylthioadenosine/adenosylhomocysteine nucleosidase n=1 Tax=Cohnella sp. AR92 TaxID=648716 RepID=UPI000F8C5653|nr:5'-methylthioadenosine/adenosylhomocysteine nucleosidase [Cohnella sp. AR92]RUS48346.1 5'-methylthioadenosine/adenosylhomocysteine nucleosidase [Cohnella sp. AR92]